MWDDGNRSSDEPRDVMSEKLTLVDSFRKLHPGPCAVVSTKLTSPCADAVAFKALIALECAVSFRKFFSRGLNLRHMAGARDVA
jgi:hypothetical protein